MPEPSFTQLNRTIESLRLLSTAPDRRHNSAGSPGWTCRSVSRTSCSTARGPKASGTATLLFATDDRGRRTDTWLQSNAGHTVWAARSHTDYDKSGRVIRVTGDTGTGDSSYTRVVDESSSAGPHGPEPRPALLRLL